MYGSCTNNSGDFVTNPREIDFSKKIRPGWWPTTLPPMARSLPKVVTTKRVDKVIGSCSETVVRGNFGGEILSRFQKRGGSFRGNGVSAWKQSKGSSCWAAGRRPDEAWGSLPGRSAARIYLFKGLGERDRFQPVALFVCRVC